MEKLKKPIYKKWWFWVIVVVVIGVIGSQGGKDDGKDKTNDVMGTEKQKDTEDEAISYTKYQVSELMNDLKDNALKAEDKYNAQHVEITGELSVIDSSGKYISLFPEGEDFAIVGVQCYIKNDTQKEQVIEMSKGDIVTLKGKITGVGEVLGYSLDIDEIAE